jgi:hypothetical protein
MGCAQEKASKSSKEDGQQKRSKEGVNDKKRRKRISRWKRQITNFLKEKRRYSRYALAIHRQAILLKEDGWEGVGCSYGG